MVDLLTEKVDRVLRIIELNRTVADLPVFWDWLYEVKLKRLTHEAMCAPLCRGSTVVFNCSDCQEMNKHCWTTKKCFPSRLDMRESICLICGLATMSILIGCATLVFESKIRERNSRK
uniref:Transmembrane protein 95-like protein n=1 Tax=Callorhinchus milii TaxID=7868 RepID=V9LGT5_CALMI